jgi:hypothetical protein
LQADRAKAIAESRAYAFGEYAHILLMGHELSADQRQVAIDKLARLTGLKTEVIDQHELRLYYVLRLLLLVIYF